MSSYRENMSTLTVCLICSAGDSFKSAEHIVPESLGNDLLVLAPGWVCDRCNNWCSAFEGRVLNSSILGFERCRMGVVSKKGKPARAKTHGFSWFSEPDRPPDVVSVEALWDRVAVLPDRHGNGEKIVFPVHDESNKDVAKVLLKIGVELFGVAQRTQGKKPRDLLAAQSHILGKTEESWPYFLLLCDTPPGSLVSVMQCVPEDHDYIRSCGFDIFLHEIDEHVIVVFHYGNFLGASSITSRDTEWIHQLRAWKVPFVGCPIEFANLNARS